VAHAGDDPENTVRAQYAAGTSKDKPVAGYRDEPTCTRSRRRRPTPRCASTSTTGGGRACPSTCAAASG
jgi:hypothetical protein